MKYTTQNRYLRPHQASLSDWRCFERACRCSKARKGRCQAENSVSKARTLEAHTPKCR